MSAKQERGEEEEREGLGPPEIKLEREGGLLAAMLFPATAVAVLWEGRGTSEHKNGREVRWKGNGFPPSPLLCSFVLSARLTLCFSSLPTSIFLVISLTYLISLLIN